MPRLVVGSIPYGGHIELFLVPVSARCSSVVRAFTHGTIGHRIDPSWWTHLAISRSSQSEMLLRGKNICSWHDGLSGQSFMVDPLSYFSFQPGLHDWCNKGLGMCYPVCGTMHIKEPLLLIEKSSPSGGSRFHLSLSEWSFTM